jgi:beta-glucosidase
MASLPLPVSAVDNALHGFGRDFLWGASTSAYQIEGGAQADGRGPSVWDVFAHTPGRIRDGSTGDVACDHYHRSAEDVELLAEGGYRAYRFSTSWSRILPAGTGAVNAKGLAFYDRLTDQLLARGITPWLCLFHWDLPQALQERGGWLSRDIADWFTDYAGIVADKLGDRVAHWIMLNEAIVHALFGHGLGGSAPGLTGFENFIGALHHQNLAQGRALAALRGMNRNFRLGTVMVLQPTRPASPAPQDQAAAERFDAIWNRACIDPLFLGAYPALLQDAFARVVKGDDLATIKQPIDMLGMNYYSRMHIHADPGNPTGTTFGASQVPREHTAMSWPIEPDGLTEQLLELRDRYGNPEVYITENGAAFDDTVAGDGTIDDAKRVAFLDGHLRAMLQAKRQGANLRGYFVWSLLDNFEWAEGYAKRFGIVHVDFKTLQRTPKASYRFMADVIRAQT